MNGSRGYTETVIALTANTWTQVAPYDCGRNRIILGDAVGLGCFWSINPTPVANEGVPFSLANTPGSYVFDLPAPSNAIYVKASNAGSLTVVIG